VGLGFLKYIMHDFITGCSFKVLAVLLPDILEIYNLSLFFFLGCALHRYLLSMSQMHSTAVIVQLWKTQRIKIH